MNHPTPRMRDVLREQIRAVGLALRAPAIAAATLAVVTTTMVAIDFLRGRGGVDFVPELSMIPGLVGLLLPIGVWRGEERFGTTLLWTLPVDRRHHALAKVCAGWVCLMTSIALFLLWLFVVALVTGGDILADQTLSVLPVDVVPLPGLLDPSALQAVRWTPRPLFWLVPFTAATGTYLLSSALLLGARHPLRWVVGAFLGVLLISAAGSAAGVDWMRHGPSRLLHLINQSPYGFDTLLTARTESLKTVATLSNGKTIEVWRGLPDIGQWATATLLWTAGGLAALWAAASRHREHR